MDPQVHIPQGTLLGKIMTSRKGRQIHAFQGIPFAQPPLGKLRFQSPSEAPSWTDVRLAQKEGSDCIQKHFFKGQYVGAEDCLYLNVYTVPSGENSQKLPVMVWIHGGGFFASSGSTEMYGPEFLLDQEVVLVTINYRLGTLGFLNLGTPEVTGNFGLKDQVAALKWVKNNIEHFGGDPNLVSIFGESAGGASIHYLLISPLAKGLFQRAIIQSGSAYNPWAFCEAEEAKRLSKEICKQLKCLHDDDTVNLKTLQTVSAQRCAEEGKNVKIKYKLKAELVPSLEFENSESAFLTQHPRLLEISDVPLMIGVTTHEGMLEYNESIDMENHYKTNFSNFVPCKELGINRDSEECFKKWQEIDDFYNKTFNGDFIEKYIQINSDIDFLCGVDDLVRATVSNVNRRQPVYYYQFSYDGNLGFYKKKANIKRPGACHTDELSYLFTREITPWKDEANDADLKIVDHMTKMWTDFAKFGNPTPDHGSKVVWNPVSANGDSAERVETRYLEIGENLTMHPTSMNKERMDFWRNLFFNHKKINKL